MSIDTGRLKGVATATARRILFERATPAELEDEMETITEIDRAHLVMLVEAGLMPRVSAQALLETIAALRLAAFAPLHGRPAPRGLYMAYEAYLVETLGAETAGSLHLGRSRNDLKAATLLIRLRGPVEALASEGLHLAGVLLSRARRHAGTTMPAFTHMQPAIPVTYGHYLSGLALAVLADLRALKHAAEEMDRSPLGAGAVGGTSVPIDPARTAALLGFAAPVRHSIEAVASRNAVLRLLAAATVLGATLSRLATDLLLWTSSEPPLLGLPDAVVGSSSMMPQKRNAYFLEHVQGRSAAALGAFSSAVCAVHGTPFTNHIAVGTEAMTPVSGALAAVTEAAALARLVVGRAEPDEAAMLARAEGGCTVATEMANRLVLDGGVPFREAHRRVGEAVRAGLQKGGEPFGGLRPADVAAASVHGGGPGGEGFRHAWEEAHGTWEQLRSELREVRGRWRGARRELEREVTRLAPGTGG